MRESSEQNISVKTRGQEDRAHIERVLTEASKAISQTWAEVMACISAPAVEGATYELTPEGEAIIRDLIEATPLTQDAVTAAGDALEREFDANPDHYICAVPGLSDQDVIASFEEPLYAVPGQVEDLQAQAVRRVIEANYLLAQAVEVLGPEAVDLLMHNLAVPDVAAA